MLPKREREREILMESQGNNYFKAVYLGLPERKGIEEKSKCYFSQCRG